MEKRNALGKGLSALIPDPPPPPPSADAPVTELDIDALAPSDLQPRLQMDDARLEELTASIRSHGVIQPIVVRKVDDGYEIVAGERRWRASQRAGLLKVPIVVRDIPDDRLLASALIENLQREDLNAIEEALAYRRLSDEFHLTQEQIADSVGKDRSSIANTVRLLKLPIEVRENVANGTLTMGHARTLLALAEEQTQLRVARDVVAKQLSVRETEALVKKIAEPPAPRPEPVKDVHTRAAEDRLRFVMGTRVRIVRKRKGGRIEIDFGSEDELQRLFEQLMDNR
jgi:ParB family transcriptional regulator, chromosome partitioning protein